MRLGLLRVFHSAQRRFHFLIFLRLMGPRRTLSRMIIIFWETRKQNPVGIWNNLNSIFKKIKFTVRDNPTHPWISIAVTMAKAAAAITGKYFGIVSQPIVGAVCKIVKILMPNVKAYKIGRAIKARAVFWLLCYFWIYSKLFMTFSGYYQNIRPKLNNIVSTT